MTIYCPVCNGPVVRLIGSFLADGGVRLGHYVACAQCPVVSEVEPTTGSLMDLASIKLTNLDSPLVPGFDTTPLLMPVTQLSGRKDS